MVSSPESTLTDIGYWLRLLSEPTLISTDEEAAASKRMVIYAFSAQINLFTSFFLKQPL